jgi:hypothetical protein
VTIITRIRATFFKDSQNTYCETKQKPKSKLKTMELLLLTIALTLTINATMLDAAPRKHYHVRGERPVRRELQYDPCGNNEEDISNDKDISNDGIGAQSNIFDFGNRRRLKKGKSSKSSDSAPSLAPSITAAPSVLTCGPTKSPSKAPTTPAPTQKPFVTVTADGTVSACIEEPSQTGIKEDYVNFFKYNLYVTPEANQTSAIDLVEMLLHYGMAEEFLRCNFDEAAPFYVVSVGSYRNATVSNEDCDTSNDPVPPVDTECLVILSDVNMTVFYPTVYPLSDGTASPNFVNATGEYLNSSMANGDFVFVSSDVVQTTFQGFIYDDDSTDVAAAVIVRAAAAGSNNVVFGSAMVGLGALCLLIITLFAVKLGRRRNAAYLKQLEGLNEANATFSMDGEEPGLEYLSSEGKVQIVLNRDFDYGMEGSSDELMGSLEDHPDVHHCSSATCPVCSVKRANPTFLSKSDQADGVLRWHSPPPTNPPSRSYDSLDTVNF